MRSSAVFDSRGIAMKRKHSNAVFAFQPSISLIVTALLALALSSGVRAAETVSQKIAPVSHAKSVHKEGARASHSERVEARISELRGKLDISPEQQGKWDELTQIMRDN